MTATTHRLAIEDRLAIQDLIAAYAWALDTGDVEGLVACFTPDTRMVEEVFEDPDIWEGHDGIRRPRSGITSTRPDFPGRQHHVTQVQYFPKDTGHRLLCAPFAFVTRVQGRAAVRAALHRLLRRRGRSGHRRPVALQARAPCGYGTARS